MGVRMQNALRNLRATIRQAAGKEFCGSCGAKPGEPCRTVRNKIVTPHTVRRQRAELKLSPIHHDSASWGDSVLDTRPALTTLADIIAAAHKASQNKTLIALEPKDVASVKNIDTMIIARVSKGEKASFVAVAIADDGSMWGPPFAPSPAMRQKIDHELQTAVEAVQTGSLRRLQAATKKPAKKAVTKAAKKTRKK